MLVRAKLACFVGGVYHFPGDTFDVESRKFSTFSMERYVVPKGAAVEADEAPKGVHAVHKGRGKYDVYDAEGNVIGDNLSKVEAKAMVLESEEAGTEGGEGGGEGGGE